jgi:hypothetical protein
MNRLKLFRQSLSVVILLTGCLFVSTLPSRMQVKCSKLEKPQNRLCTYGIWDFPWVSRRNCFNAKIDQVSCEQVRYSLNPAFKQSTILGDPTGSYIGKSTVLSSTTSSPRPHLVIVNYRKRSQLPISNYTFRSQAEVDFLKKDFDAFLRNPDRKSYQIEEKIPGGWILAVPFGGIFALVSLAIFQGKSLKNKPKKVSS